jgi:hypothetical protein
MINRTIFEHDDVRRLRKNRLKYKNWVAAKEIIIW